MRKIGSSKSSITFMIVASAVTLRAQNLHKIPTPNNVHSERMSAGARAWLDGPQPNGQRPNGTAPAPTFTNVDAAAQREDLAPGQEETAIASAGQRVMSVWNDATGFIVTPSTLRKASLTGVGFSADGGLTFTDLVGLPNNNPNQQWFGDPSVKAIDGGKFFIVSSMYLPSNNFDCTQGPALQSIAVSVASVNAANQVTFTNPIIATVGADMCGNDPNQALLDKDWISYDPVSRTLGLSYTRFYFFSPHTGNGQIELVRAHIPLDPTTLTTANFSAPVIVWREESAVENEGAYVAEAPGGDAYLGWERNWFTNQFNGDPYVYIQAAFVPQGACPLATTGITAFCHLPVLGGQQTPRIVTLGQVNSNGNGGVRSLDVVPIAGYNRGTGNDFPRVAVNVPHRTVIYVWNDASLHFLGDIWMRSMTFNLEPLSAIRRVNDDNDSVLHFMPAVSIRSDGSIATSWYDRRLSGPTSSQTDYFGEIRPNVSVNGTDFRISTTSTDWLGTSSYSVPNFGDYTDNDSNGMTTYFTWTDGRLGIPQPFVAKQ